MTKLSSKKILQEANNGDPNSIKSLTLNHRALADVSCLIEFKNLERLDLGSNNLTSLEGLKPCVNLKWLSVVQNLLQSLRGIEGLTKLTVLNAGKNKLKSMDEITSLVSLRAIILNDNEISSICKLEQLKELNTLVLSRNPIRKFGVSLSKNKLVTKLSLSNCQLEVIGSSLTACTDLKELRLAHNYIETLPVELGHNSWLQNLDLGNNSITNWSDVKVLSSLVNLRNLNLQGNPISDLQNTAKKIKKLLPNLQIYNGRPVDKIATQEGDKVTASVVDDGNELVGEEKKLIEVPSGKKLKKKHHGGDDDTVNVWDQHNMEKQVMPKELKREERSKDQTANGSREKKVKGEKKQERHEKELSTKVHGEDKVSIGKSGKKSKKSTKASDEMFIDDKEAPFAELFAAEAAHDSSTVTSDVVKKKHKRQEKESTPAHGEDKSVMGKSERKSRKKSKQSNDTSVIDNREAPFVELFANEEVGDDMTNGLNVHTKTGLADRLSTIPTKTKQNKKPGAHAAILELSKVVEIGLGGPSAWD